jgi:hypothetical protein
MKSKINLKEIEKKAFRSTFQDGLWDIYLGILLINISILPWIVEVYLSVIEVAVFGIIVALISMIFFFGGKKLITVPRMGLIKFGTERKTKLKKVSAIMFLSVFVGTATFLLAKYMTTIAGIPVPFLIFSANCLIVFGLGAYFMNFERLYIYGFFYAIPLPVGYLMMKNSYPVTNVILICSIPGITMVVYGCVLFFQFLHNYTKPTKEVTYAK